MTPYGITELRSVNPSVYNISQTIPLLFLFVFVFVLFLRGRGNERFLDSSIIYSQ